MTAATTEIFSRRLVYPFRGRLREEGPHLSAHCKAERKKIFLPLQFLMTRMRPFGTPHWLQSLQSPGETDRHQQTVRILTKSALLALYLWCLVERRRGNVTLFFPFRLAGKKHV